MYVKHHSPDKENDGMDQLQDKKGVERNVNATGLLSRRANASPAGSLNSLDLLRKPMNRDPSPNLYTDEEIAKNTDLNKKLGGYRTNNPSSNSSYLASLDTANQPPSTDTSVPVYRKDGLPIKSSLKSRSRSLPASPHLGEAAPQRLVLQRSKSVHFDQRTPVKYFELDESPLASVSHEGEVQELSFQTKPVGFLQDEEPSPPELQEPPKPLRKSKRFDALNRGRQIPKIQGLYAVNFPVISSRDPRILQLNVFLSLARDKQVFLQDLVLHVFKQGASVEGKVMVKDLCYDKRVAVRYTWDLWKTVQEVECVYKCSGERFLPGTKTDMFTFMLEKPEKYTTLHLCVQYIARTDGWRKEFWDNNDNQNYQLHVRTDWFRNPFS